MKTRAPKRLNLLLIAAALTLPLQSAKAELISTDEVASHAKIQEERDKVRAFLSRTDAQQNLVALGVAPELAKQRVDALTDAEVMNLAGKIDSLPAGGALSNQELILIVLIAILVAILI
jgi:hypothetical protein